MLCPSEASSASSTAGTYWTWSSPAAVSRPRSSRSPNTGPLLPLSVPPKRRREESKRQHAAPVSPRSRCLCRFCGSGHRKRRGFHAVEETAEILRQTCAEGESGSSKQPMCCSAGV
eukprot:2654997-Rhodomonas_salina.1